MNTQRMIQILFPKTKNITEIVGILEKYKNFGVDTNLRMAHFLAQIRQEIGDNFKPTSESFNYTAIRIAEVFKKRFDINGNKQLDPFEIQLIRSVIGYPEQIASIAYANRLGNGDVASNDGWNYRGAGVLQVTGRYNFSEVQKRIEKYAPGSKVNIVENPEDIHTLEGSILAGLAFWIWKDIYKKADLGKEEINVDAVTKVINKYTDSYMDRRVHFNRIKHLI